MSSRRLLQILSLPITLVAIALVAGLVSLSHSNNAEALDVSGFNPELIISDSAFTDYNSMSANDIQTFFNSKNSVCLKNFQTLSLVDQNNDGLGDEPYGRGANEQVSAATLIWQAAQLYRISPKVILATLEKEQGLITRGDCPSWRYNTALGYGCPDHEPCDSSAYGFTRQIDYGVWHFRGFYDDTYPIPPTVPGSKFINYNPDSSCGGSTLTIQNRATAALYSYTPYQPNSAALAAAPGQVVNCGAYGNLNFWRYYSVWFGSTSASYTNMDSRWLTIKNDTYKVSPLNGGSDTSYVVQAGRQVFFNSKIWLDEEWCLRTLYDTSNNHDRCIPFSKLSEFTIQYSDFSTPQTVQVSSTTNKAYLPNNTRYDPDGLLPVGRIIDISGETFIDGKRYVRTTTDKERGLLLGIPADRVSSLNYTLEDIEPLDLTTTTSTQKTLAINQSPDPYQIPAGTTRTFVDTMTLDGVRYFRTETDKRSFMGRGVRESDLAYAGISFSEPRWMQLKEPLRKLNLMSNEVDSLQLTTGQRIKFTTKVYLNDRWYYRTEHDSRNHNNLWIDASKVEEIPFTPMSSPRQMRVLTNTSWRLPTQERKSSRNINANSILSFTKRIEVNGILYLSTDTESSGDPRLAIPYSELGEL